MARREIRRDQVIQATATDAASKRDGSEPGRARPAARRAMRATLVALGATLATLVLGSGSALAVSSHPYATTFPTGGTGNHREVATDKVGNVYVACEAEGANGLRGSIRKFDSSGNPANFTASEPYINGNEINEDPAPNTSGFEQEPEFGNYIILAVDKSNSVRSGYIYVNSPQLNNVDIFDPTGKYVTSIKSSPGMEPAGVGVGPDGYVYVMWAGFFTHIGKYDPETYIEVERINTTNGVSEFPYGDLFTGACCVRVRADSTGAVWTEWGGYFFDGTYEGERIGKWESDQWTDKLLSQFGHNPESKIGFESPYMDEKYEIENYPAKCPRPPQPNEGASKQRCSLAGHVFEVDPNTDELYLVPNEKENIIAYSPGVPGDPVHQVAAPFGGGHLEGSAQGVAIDNAGNLYTTIEPNKVVKFTRGTTLPSVLTKPAAIADEGHEEITVRGVIDPSGGGEVTSCQAAWGTTAKHTSSPVSCNEATPYPGSGTKEVSATITGLQVAHVYHVRLESGNAAGTGFGTDRVFETKAVLSLLTEPATGVDEHNATLQGQFDADGMETTYWYEFGPNTNYGQETEHVTTEGEPGEILQVPQALTHLQSGHVYHYRLVAQNELGITKGPDERFRTASAPEITGVGVENVQETTADVFAKINPVGYDTTYWFEYGTTPAYGSKAPVGGEDIGAGTEPVPVKVHLEGLPAGATIHFRVVAENSWGRSQSDDTTFNFRPPDCPNAHVRALTGSNYLPDCRAYELVTPGEAGAVQLLPPEGYEGFAEGFGGNAFTQTRLNFGYANHPSRFAYMGALGAVEETEAANAFLDYYEATRTNKGWVTTIPGLKGTETLHTYWRFCSESQDLCIDHIGPHFKYNEQTKEVYEVPKEESPFLYKADGTRLGRLPTNVATVKEGTNFHGDNLPSGDFSHFVFSTHTKFTPDGQESPPGSVYDNDIAAKTVTVISKDGDGNPIEREPVPAAQNDPERVTGIVGVSTDGSRVLMGGTTFPYCNVEQFPFECEYELNWPVRLYMRENAAVTKEVSRGHEVTFAGMNRSGSKVYFISDEQLLPQDEDESGDLYLWEAVGDKLTLVSQEGTLGNDDECSATWTENCGVKQITPQFMEEGKFFDRHARVPGMDDILAPNSGDIYFYSPEDLVEGEIGGNGQRNLYLFRNGHLRLVTTFEPGTEIERSTISEDGSHAAFVTRASLTPYDAHGDHEVYSYDAESGALRCASCPPSGGPPKGDTVSASKSGPFMANDGRTFFATSEALVPQDTDGIRDVYEYAGGHAQLISSGTGEQDSTGGLEIIGFFFRNLAPEDHNGNFIKAYDARSGGGFDIVPDLGNCAAADECHGAGSTPPPTPEIATGAHLGASGNLHPATSKKHRKRHHRHHRRHRRHGKRHAKRHGGRRNG
jgi:hypothetical protein